VALFSGCVQDFVYPEQLEAGVKVLGDQSVDLAFPMDQTCCGLPLQMMGEKEAARAIAIQNIAAFEQGDYGYILTLCASCASHLKNAVPELFADDPVWTGRARAFADKVITFSQFVQNVLQIDPALFKGAGQRTTYHAPCHLCRGMGEHDAPKALIRKAGLTFIPAAEEETCCGFGGTYSGKFPEISSQILTRKLDDFEATGADLLVTECPGCVMQLRGGALKRGDRISVFHIAEALAEHLKNKSIAPH
jgi:Fe-S oxidoreductase